MNKLKTLKGAALVAATSMLPLSQAAMADVSISGWINEGIQFYDDGVSSDAVAISDNGTTLGSRITFAASSEVSSGLTAGMEVILEPLSNNTPLIFSNQDGPGGLGGGVFGDTTGDVLLVLGSSLNIGGAWGKITAGLQSMPTDNIAVLEDPSLTLWSGISPVFRGNGFTMRSASGAAGGTVWGNYLNCFGSGLRGAGGIGIDCNGIYRNGIRYDLPAFGPVTIAIGYANDDVYDIAAKWKGSLGRMNGSIALGYSINQGITPFTTDLASGIAAVSAAAFATFTSGAGGSADFVTFNEAETFQVQAGLMDPVSGIFGSIAYQSEDADLVAGAQAANTALGLGGVISDDSDAWWLKVGIKKKWFAAGDTSIAFDYGQYNDQYGVIQAALGVTGSEVERIGVSIDQYFGSSLIVYGKWEQLDLDLDTSATSDALYNAVYGTTLGGDVEELDTFTLGATYFF